MEEVKYTSVGTGSVLTFRYRRVRVLVKLIKQCKQSRGLVKKSLVSYCTLLTKREEAVESMVAEV